MRELIVAKARGPGEGHCAIGQAGSDLLNSSDGAIL